MELTTSFAVLVPIVIGLVEIGKMSGVPAKFAPLLSLVLGVSGAILLVGGSLNVAIMQGILVGLASSGLYSNVVTASRGFK